MENSKRRKGFTLVEIIIAITIVGVLAAVVISGINAVRVKGFDAKRIADMNMVRAALDLYYDSQTNGSYPSTSGQWWGECVFGGSASANNAIPGLAPAFIPTVPSDPQMKKNTSNCCYVYRSDGVNYKFLAGYDCTPSKLCTNVQTSSPYYDPYPRNYVCMVTSSSTVTRLW